MFVSSTRSLGRTIVRLVGVIALTMGALTVSMGTASAHHAEITGTATCARTVDWRATAWQSSDPQARTNSQVDVFKQIDGGAWEPVQSGAFNPGNDFSFAGQFSGFPADVNAIRLKVVVVANWANGVQGGQVNYADVAIPTDCEQPPVEAAQPTATGEVDCSGYDLVLANTDGTAPADFTVTTPTGATETHTVPAGETLNLTYPVIEDATSSVAVTADGLEPFGLTYTADCEQPPVEAAQPTATGEVDCSGYDLVLANTDGTAPADFTVTTPTGATETHTVPAGETLNLTYPVIEDATSSVAVTADGLEPFGLTYTADCEQPPVEAAQPTATGEVDCSGYDLVLGNTDGTAPADFTVTTPTGATETHTVPAGETLDLTYPVIEDATSSVLVVAPGLDEFELSYTADCVETPEEPVTPPTTDKPEKPVTPENPVTPVEPVNPVTPAAGPPTTELTQAPVLPATGSSVSPWLALLGAGLLLGGVALTRRSIA